MQYQRKVLFGLVLTVCLLSGPTKAVAEPLFGYEIETDVVYGQGKVAPDGKEQMRDLKMDVYTPTNAGNSPWPGVVYVHGGAYHRGGRRLPPFQEAGAVHARPEDWARLLTPLGYICFVIEYRLAPELPQPDHMPATGNLLPVDKVVTPPGIARTNFVRRAMSLPEITDETAILAWNAAMAGAEDTAKAVRYIHDNAEALGVDPDRIALGGHSAGAGNVLNATYGLRASVAAAFPLSAPELMIDWSKTDLTGLPPALVVASQFDIDAVLEALPDTTDNLRGAGVETSLAWVPGFPHFYPTGAVSLGDDGTRMSIGDRVAKFLDKHLKQ